MSGLWPDHVETAATNDVCVMRRVNRFQRLLALPTSSGQVTR